MEIDAFVNDSDNEGNNGETKKTKPKKHSFSKEMLEFAEKHLADGGSVRELERIFSEKGWGGFQKARRLAAIIRRRWFTAFMAEKSEVQAQAIEIRRRLFERAVADGDYKTALEVLRDIDRLCGMDDIGIGSKEEGITVKILKSLG